MKWNENELKMSNLLAAATFGEVDIMSFSIKDDYRYVADVYMKNATSIEDAVNQAYRLTESELQNNNWFKSNSGVVFPKTGLLGNERSSSLGDLFEVCGEYFLISHSGLIRVEDPNTYRKVKLSSLSFESNAPEVDFMDVATFDLELPLVDWKNGEEGVKTRLQMKVSTYGTNYGKGTQVKVEYFRDGVLLPSLGRTLDIGMSYGHNFELNDDAISVLFDGFPGDYTKGVPEFFYINVQDECIFYEHHSALEDEDEDSHPDDMGYDDYNEDFSVAIYQNVA